MVAKGLSSALARTGLPLLLITLAAFPVEAAIVDSISGFQNEKGWAGKLDAGFDASGGNTEETSLSAGARLQWRGETEMWRLLGSARRTSVEGTETARALMAHLRHNHRLGGRWHTLAFVQAQENPFQRLESRWLLGAGLRWDVLQTDKQRFSLGLAHMQEREKIEEQDAEWIERASLFLNLALQLREGVTLSGLAFFQPAWSDLEDWRTMGNFELEVELAAGLALVSGLSLEGDSRPAAGVEKVDWTTSTALRFKF